MIKIATKMLLFFLSPSRAAGKNNHPLPSQGSGDASGNTADKSLDVSVMKTGCPSAAKLQEKLHKVFIEATLPVTS